MTNDLIAKRLRIEAQELSNKSEFFYAAEAFRKAADVIQTSNEQIQDIFDRWGPRSLEALPCIGPRIAERISGYIRFEKALEKLKRISQPSLN